MKKKTTEKFHGMIVVSDDDLITVRGKDVVEMNSADELVCRSYDLEGNAEDNSFKIELEADIFYNPNLKEENITGAIKRAIGKRDVLISRSAIDFVKALV